MSAWLMGVLIKKRGKNMRTKEQYFEGLKKLRPNLYFNGEKIGRDHEALAPSINVIGATYDAAHDPETRDLFTATSHLTGETINRFCHIHQSKEDLHNKQDMTRALCQKVGYCVGRCMGVDALNAINAISYEADKANKGETNYYKTSPNGWRSSSEKTWWAPAPRLT